MIAARSGAAADAADGMVTAWTWNEAAWSEGAALMLPRGSRPVALAVTALGKDRRSALAVALLDGPERVLLSWTLSEGAWSEPKRQVLADQPATDGALRPAGLSPARAGGHPRPALADAERLGMWLRWLRWALVIAAVPVLVLQLRHLAKMRER